MSDLWESMMVGVSTWSPFLAIIVALLCKKDSK